ncbi:MAG: hypothetical protein L3J70_05015 [Gammaproteobacteria bacterium]|nr:hypothetical protein [Gammaproteobacteria bacterium]
MISLRIFRSSLILLLCQSLAFSPVVFAEQLALPSGDLIAPKIVFTPITKPINADEALELSATVTDNVAVQSVTLFYRTIGTSDYERTALQREEQTDQYHTTIDAVQSPGIEYYLQATDLAGNTLLRGYSFSPLIVNVNTAVDSPTTESTASILEAETKPEIEIEKSSSKKWLWIGLGVLAVGAIASSGGGSDGDDPAPTTGTTITIGGSAP